MNWLACASRNTGFVILTINSESFLRWFARCHRALTTRCEHPPTSAMVCPTSALFDPHLPLFYSSAIDRGRTGLPA